MDATHFSRKVNLQEADRPWHGDFHYFGANVYAYVLAKYGTWIDFVSMQFYESFSRASMAIHYNGTTPADYLQDYTERLVASKETFWVQFSQDPTCQLEDQWVTFPVSKLVWGFANGWAAAAAAAAVGNSNDGAAHKTLYVEPRDIQTAYSNLRRQHHEPRGFMFWVIGEEGTANIDYARSLNQILKVRTEVDDGVPAVPHPEL